MTVWTPEGMLGKLFRLLADYAPTELALAAPIEWGVERTIQARLGPYGEIAITPQAVGFRAISPDHWVEFMKTYFGPAIRAFGASTPAARKALAEEMRALIQEFNRAENGTVLAPTAYLEIVVTRSAS